MKEDIRPIDSLIDFATSKDAKESLGEESAKALAEHAVDIKINGGKFCDCSACEAAGKILGEELCKKIFVAEGLQIIVTQLSQQADGHFIQSKIFASQGLSKFAKNYQNAAKSP